MSSQELLEEIHQRYRSEQPDSEKRLIWALALDLLLQEAFTGDKTSVYDWLAWKDKRRR